MTLYRRGDTFHYDFIMDGRRYRGSTGATTRTKATEFEEQLKVQLRSTASLDSIWQATKEAKLKCVSVPLEFDVVWKLYSGKSLSKAGEERTKTYMKHVRLFIDWMREAHPEVKSVGDVLSSHAAEYVADLRSKPGAPYTKNDKLTTLRTLFRVLGQEAGIMENPFDGIGKMKCSYVSRDIYTPEELRLIGQAATGWILDLCLTALSTGLREGDICNLRWTDVSEDLRWLHLERVRKTGRPIDIPILPALQRHLIDARADAAGDEHVYPVLYRMYTEAPGEIGKRLKEFLSETGIDGTRKTVDGYCRAVSKKDAHAFRHTFVYLAACNGIPFPIVQAIVGHASPAMTKIYMDHASQADKEKYLAQLPDYMLPAAPTPPPPPPADTPKAVDRKQVEYIIKLVANGAPAGEVIAELRRLL